MSIKRIKIPRLQIAHGRPGITIKIWEIAKRENILIVEHGVKWYHGCQKYCSAGCSDD